MPRIIKHNVATNSTTVPEFCHHGPKRSRHLSGSGEKKIDRIGTCCLTRSIWVYIYIYICMRIIVYIHICTYIYIYRKLIQIVICSRPLQFQHWTLRLPPTSFNDSSSGSVSSDNNSPQMGSHQGFIWRVCVSLLSLSQNEYVFDNSIFYLRHDESYMNISYCTHSQQQKAIKHTHPVGFPRTLTDFHDFHVELLEKKFTLKDT